MITLRLAPIERLICIVGCWLAVTLVVAFGFLLRNFGRLTLGLFANFIFGRVLVLASLHPKSLVKEKDELAIATVDDICQFHIIEAETDPSPNDVLVLRILCGDSWLIVS